MKLDTKLNLQNSVYKLVYQPSSEGISKRITFFKSRLPLQIKCKPLWYTKK